MLQQLIDEYVTKMNNIDQLIKEKQQTEKKTSLITTDRNNIKKQIRQALIKAGIENFQSFLIEFDGKQVVCQIDTEVYSSTEGFISFYYITPMEEVIPTKEQA